MLYEFDHQQIATPETSTGASDEQLMALIQRGDITFNDKMLGHGEPIRVRRGERVLFRLLNASATENVTLALPRHRFTVMALDGNAVPSPRAVDTLFLAPAERADVIVEMNDPGVWILGSIKEEDRKIGLAFAFQDIADGPRPCRDGGRRVVGLDGGPHPQA